jgi:hypothetical protein
MFVVLCDPDDTGALWLIQRLRERGEDCALVTTDLLSFARKRSQRIGRDGVSAEVDLDGRTLLDGRTVLDGRTMPGSTGPEHPDVLINRMCAPPLAAWRSAPAAERDYATAELTAFALSWLDGMPDPVRNRPDPSCLAGPAPHPLRAGALAAAAGLTCADVRLDSDQGMPPGRHLLLEAALRQAGRDGRVLHIVVLDGEIVDPEGVARQAGAPAPAGFAAAVRRLCTSLGAGQALLGLDVVVCDGEWVFGGVTPLPDLPVAGGALVDALVRLRDEATPSTTPSRAATPREKVTA